MLLLLFGTPLIKTPNAGSVFRLTQGRGAAEKTAPSTMSVQTVGTKATANSLAEGKEEDRPQCQRQLLQCKSNPDIVHLAPTPVNLGCLEQFLFHYPKVDERNMLLEGFRYGFRVKYNGPRRAKQAKNLKSIGENFEIACQKVAKEVELGRVAGPFTKPPFPNLQVSPLGLVPKKSPGEYRLIHHLSHPHGRSINDFISEEDSTVHYTRFDTAVNFMRDLGQGALLGKLDVKGAFRILPISPRDFELLGFRLDGCYFVDKCLPMGLSRSCQLFEAFSTFLEWQLRKMVQGSYVTHYLDDFLILGPPGNTLCRRTMGAFMSLCDSLGIPLADEKTEGPVSTLVFLGLELNSEAQTVKVPENKVTGLKELINCLLSKKKATLKEVQQVIGTMQFACRAVVPGRTFMRRLIGLTSGVKRPHHYIRVTQEAKRDLEMWLCFLDQFNGVSSMLDKQWLFNSDINLFTDASGSWGFAAYFDGRFIHSPWGPHFAEERQSNNISFLELFPICVAMEVWGEELRSKKIIFHCDNLGIVEVLNKQTAKCTRIMSLLRALVLQCLRHNIIFRAEHVPGKRNSIADALSRFQMTRFRQLAPEADAQGTPFPARLWQL